MIVIGGDRYFYPVHTQSTSIEMFLLLVEQDLKALNEKVEKTSFQPVNLTKAERLVLKTLKTHKGIVIRQADKGGSVVVMSVED